MSKNNFNIFSIEMNELLMLGSVYRHLYINIERQGKSSSHLNKVYCEISYLNALTI